MTCYIFPTVIFKIFPTKVTCKIFPKYGFRTFTISAFSFQVTTDLTWTNLLVPHSCLPVSTLAIYSKNVSNDFRSVLVNVLQVKTVSCYILLERFSMKKDTFARVKNFYA